MTADNDNEFVLYVFTLLDMPFSIFTRMSVVKRVYVAAKDYADALFVAQVAFNEKRGSYLRFAGGSAQYDMSSHLYRGYYDASTIDFDPALEADVHLTFPFVRVLNRDEKLQELLSGS